MPSHVPDQLIRDLEAAFPTLSPRKQLESEQKDLWFALGQQDIIAWLSQHNAWEKKDSIESVVPST